MTANELKMIRSVLKPFVDNGLLSDSVIDEIATLTTKSGSKDIKKNRPDLITREEAATLLQVSQQSLINWEHAGKIKAIKVAGSRLVRYHMHDIDSLLVK